MRVTTTAARSERPTSAGSARSGPTNVAGLLTRHAAQRPQQLALVQRGAERRTLTWVALEDQVAAVASGLASYGLVAGQRVVLSSANSIEFVIAYLAALRAGFVCVPVDPNSTPGELRTVLQDSGARLLLSAGPTDAPGVLTLPLTAGGLAEIAGRGSGAVGSPVDAEALAVLLYTAGTSGEPKAAMLTHRALLSHLEHFETYGIVDDETVVLAVLPLFHVFGLNAVLGACLMAGATCVVCDQVEVLLETVVEERVTNLPLAPSVLYRLLQHEDLGAALTSVTTVVSGVSPLPPALAASFTQRTGLRVEQGYGLTEAAPGVTVTLGSLVTGPGHVGRPLPGVDVRIGDGRDEIEPGEISIRGGNLFSGYWPDGQGAPDAGGWFATGDIGYLASGELFLVDRARELILVHGFHVYPAEVESVIRELTGVEEVAVIGRADATAGEQVVAFVVAAGLTVDEVSEHCALRLARFKRPAVVHLLDALPRGATGRVKKGVLRQLGVADGDPSAPGTGGNS